MTRDLLNLSVMDLPNDTFRYQDKVFDYADHSTSSGNNVTATSDNNTTAEQIREIEEMNNAAVIQAGNNKLASEAAERQHTNGSANVYEDNNTNIAPAVEPMNVEEGGTSDSTKPVIADFGLRIIYNDLSFIFIICK